jgi:hypothetical protein
MFRSGLAPKTQGNETNAKSTQRQQGKTNFDLRQVYVGFVMEGGTEIGFSLSIRFIPPGLHTHDHSTTIHVT